MEANAAIAFGAFMIVYLLIMLGLVVISYVFPAIAYHTVANRRGIKNGWLAWIPVGNLWILGCIADQFQSARKGKKVNLRVPLLVLTVLMYLFSFGFMGVYLTYVVRMVVSGFSNGFTADFADAFLTYTMGAEGAALVIAISLFYLLMLGFSVAVSVMMYICLYRFYLSTNPQNATVYLVLSILITVTMPFLVFSCRKYDAPAQVPYQPPYIPPMEDNNL